jgi:hypothetical protein
MATAPECRAAKIALEWMFVEAERAGLLLDSRKVEIILGRAGHLYLRDRASELPSRHTG